MKMTRERECRRGVVSQHSIAQSEQEYSSNERYHHNHQIPLIFLRWFSKHEQDKHRERGG